MVSHDKKVYHAVALRFCELHDTPGRMLEKGVISAVVPWKSSRLFFGNRLRRRLAEARVGKSKLMVAEKKKRFFLVSDVLVSEFYWRHQQ